MRKPPCFCIMSATTRLSKSRLCSSVWGRLSWPSRRDNNTRSHVGFPREDGITFSILPSPRACKTIGRKFVLVWRTLRRASLCMTAVRTLANPLWTTCGNLLQPSSSGPSKRHIIWLFLNFLTTLTALRRSIGSRTLPTTCSSLGTKLVPSRDRLRFLETSVASECRNCAISLVELWNWSCVGKGIDGTKWRSVSLPSFFLLKGKGANLDNLCEMIRRLTDEIKTLEENSKHLATSSTAQGGGGSFKNRKPIGEIGCCESRMAERSHWWTERWLRSLSLSLSFSDYRSTWLFIYLSI